MRSETSIRKRVAQLENNYDSDRKDPEAQVVHSTRKALVELAGENEDELAQRLSIRRE